MENQISKQQIVAYLKEQVEEFQKTMEGYTNKGPNYRATEATFSTYWSLLTLIEHGRFDKIDFK